MSLKNSASPLDPTSAQRIRINKRRDTSPAGEDPGKRSMDMAQAFEHQKAMAQNYREKNERNIVKCKFLYNKLTTLGNLEGVPQMIASEVSELDEKMRQLEALLSSKRQVQMRKLRKKVGSFLQQVSFEIQNEDLQKLQDEVELILFLIDIFEEKFKEMTDERKEIDEIIARLQRENTADPLASSNQLKRHNSQLKIENERLLSKLLSIQHQLQRGKDKRYDGPRDSVAQQQLAAKGVELQRQAKCIEDMEVEVADAKAKLKILEGELQRLKRQEVRLKERFRVMQAQKNERIKLLEQSFNRG